MTEQQVNFCKQHDWFVSFDVVGAVYSVTVRDAGSSRAKRFTRFDSVLAWAGY